MEKPKAQDIEPREDTPKVEDDTKAPKEVDDTKAPKEVQELEERKKEVTSSSSSSNVEHKPPPPSDSPCLACEKEVFEKEAFATLGITYKQYGRGLRPYLCLKKEELPGTMDELRKLLTRRNGYETLVIIGVNLVELQKEYLEEEKKSKEEGREPRKKDWNSFYKNYEKKQKDNVEDRKKQVI